MQLVDSVIKIDISDKGINPGSKGKNDVVKVGSLMGNNIKETNLESFISPPIRDSFNLHQTESIWRINKRHSSQLI